MAELFRGHFVGDNGGNGSILLFPAGTKEKEWEKGIGTGGYMLEAWEPGVRALTKRNPNYWKEGRAHFDQVETLVITDVNARTNALKTGRLEAMDRAKVKTVHLLKRMPNINVTAVAGTMHYSMPMMVDQAPYQVDNVRLALKYAVDLEEMVKKILKGYGAMTIPSPP